jgi:hypothetical protein
MMRALPALMRARKDIKVVLVGGDGVSYGSGPRQGGNWREFMLAEVGKEIDRDRVVSPAAFPTPPTSPCCSGRMRTST